MSLDSANRRARVQAERRPEQRFSLFSDALPHTVLSQIRLHDCIAGPVTVTYLTPH
jgi:hypothetical protein